MNHLLCYNENGGRYSLKKYYFCIVFLILLFAVPFYVKADCTYNEKVRLQKLAGNVNFSYHYTETEHSIIFNITVSNLTSELYMIDQTTKKTYYANNEDFVIEGYTPGSTVQFDFYVRDSSCETKSIFTNYVTLPSYNPYYKNEICKGIEEYKFCQKWLKHNMTYKEFYNNVLNYKTKEIEKVKEEEKKVKEEFDWAIVIDFWAKYYVYILLAIIIIGGVTLYLYDKNTDL